MTNILNIYYKSKYFCIYIFIFRIFISRIDNYNFKRMVNIVDNRKNFNNNLKY